MKNNIVTSVLCITIFFIIKIHPQCDPQAFLKYYETTHKVDDTYN
jgi:hypothetical protein